VQRKMNLSDFLFPVLLGYAEGGTLVFVAEAEAPTNFLGAVSLGFCPTLPISGPLCPGWGFHGKPGNDGKSETILPTLDLRYPWVVLEGTGATSCQPEAFVKRVPRGIYVEADAKNATSQVNFQVNQLLQTIHAPAANTGLADLPIFELNGNGSGDSILILISGDGGWVSLDREIGNYLFGKGVSVIGFDSLRYFWKGKTPQEAARDIKRIMAYYLQAWHKKKVILAGYSMGADVLPFIVKRMHPRDLKEVSAVALIGPSSKADFQTGPLMADEEPGKAKQIFPALRNLTDLRLVCIGGSLERPPSLCERLQEDKKMSKEIEIQFLPSGHMFQMNPIPISDLLNQKFHLY
jgi:Type IV secretory pathway, VirJ component